MGREGKEARIVSSGILQGNVERRLFGKFSRDRRGPKNAGGSKGIGESEIGRITLDSCQSSELSRRGSGTITWDGDLALEETFAEDAIGAEDVRMQGKEEEDE